MALKFSSMRKALIVAPLIVIATTVLYLYHFDHYADQFPIYFRPPAEKFPYRLYYLMVLAVALLLWAFSLWKSRSSQKTDAARPDIFRLVVQLFGALALVYLGYQLFF